MAPKSPKPDYRGALDLASAHEAVALANLHVELARSLSVMREAGTRWVDVLRELRFMADELRKCGKLPFVTEQTVERSGSGE